MVQGIKFDPSDTSDIKDITTQFNGNVRAIAKHYGVKRQTIYDYFKRQPEGMKIIEECRQHNHEEFLDDAEFVYKYALANYKNNLALAMRAADKVIDKKGHTRNWKEDKDKSKDSNTIILEPKDYSKAIIE